MESKFIICKWLIWLSLITVLSCQELQENYFVNTTRNTMEIAETSILQNNLKATHAAEINEYVEILLPELNNFLKTKCMDGASMPNIENEFKKRILLITYHGIIYLKNGWLSGLSTTKLYRDARVTYNYPNLKVRMSLGYKTLKFDYDYTSKFMDLGPEGKVHGTLKNFKFTIGLDINMITLNMQVPKFEVNSLGTSSIRFTGNVLTDWFQNMLTPIIKPLITPIIKDIIEDYFDKNLETMAKHFNKSVCWLLQSC